jgi:hypothetical protein
VVIQFPSSLVLTTLSPSQEKTLERAYHSLVYDEQIIRGISLDYDRKVLAWESFLFDMELQFLQIQRGGMGRTSCCFGALGLKKSSSFLLVTAAAAAPRQVNECPMHN